MEYLAEFILSGGILNGAIVGAVFAFIAAVLGMLAGKLLFKIFKKEGIIKWTAIIFVVFSFQIPNLIKPYLKETYGTAQQEKSVESVMQEIEKQRIFSVIFRYHPDARSRLADKMKYIIYSGNAIDGEISRLSQKASSEIVNEYFNKYLPSASDEQTRALLKRNHEVLLAFKDKPILCVGYYLGKPNFSPPDITPEFVEQEGNIKADIIQSAINNPSITPRAGSIDKIVEIIALGYQKKNYDLENLAKLDAIQNLDPNEGCNVAIEFSDVLASLDAKTGAFVFKNLLYIGNDDSQNLLD